MGSWVHGFMFSLSHGVMGSWGRGHGIMCSLVRGFMGSWVMIWTAFAIVGPLPRLPGHACCVFPRPCSLMCNENPINLKTLLGNYTRNNRGSRPRAISPHKGS